MIELYFSVLMLFGASQAVTGIVLLLGNPKRAFANYLLSLLLFFWGFSCYWFFAFIHQEPFFNLGVTTFIGPMLALTLFPPVYLYVKYLFYGQTRFDPKDHIHFLAIYLYILFTLYLFFDSKGSFMLMRKHSLYALRYQISSWVATFQGPIYFLMTHRILKLRHEHLLQHYSELESRKLEWFRWINISFAVVFIIGGISSIFKTAYLNPYALYMGYHGVMALCIFYITLMIYKYPAIFMKENGKQIAPSPIPLSEYGLVHMPGSKPIVEHEEEEDVQEVVDKLNRVMEQDKIFRNPSLSLNDLAVNISETRNTISHVLNNHIHKSFYDYINTLRIEESKRYFRDEKYKHYTIEAIAAEAGFKTTSVFYKFFKSQVNMTPSEYRDRKESVK